MTTIERKVKWVKEQSKQIKKELKHKVGEHSFIAELPVLIELNENGLVINVEENNPLIVLTKVERANLCPICEKPVDQINDNFTRVKTGEFYHDTCYYQNFEEIKRQVEESLADVVESQRKAEEAINNLK